MSPSRTRPRLLLRLVVLSLAAALPAALGAACGGPVPTASPTVPPSPTASAAPTASPTPLSSEALEDLYLQINGQVEALRGLTEKEPVVPFIVSQSELNDHLQNVTDRDSPPDVLAAYERLYKAMGLMDEGASLKETYTELLESQVAGTYDPVEKKLYVLSRTGDVGPFERSTYAHEYEHALQDQYFDLQSKSNELKDNSDRGMAWQSVFEGDAYTVGSLWMIQELNPFEIGDLLGQSQDPEAMAALEKIPPIVQNQLLFAAINGALWTSQVYAGGGWDAVNNSFTDPPVSTEQILHPDKWAAREAPIEVDLPDDLAASIGTGWKTSLEDTFGEQQFNVWVTGKVDIAAAISPPPPPESVAGWGGDRQMFLEGPDGAWAVVMKTAWDTDRDADQFESGIAPLVERASGPGAVLPGEGGAVRWIVIGSDEATLSRVSGVLGLAG
jgi:hypothetical protein